MRSMGFVIMSKRLRGYRFVLFLRAEGDKRNARREPGRSLYCERRITDRQIIIGIPSRHQLNIPDHHSVAAWERIYLEEDAEGLRIERRGRKSTGRTPKLEKKVEENLIMDNHCPFAHQFSEKIAYIGKRLPTSAMSLGVVLSVIYC